MTGSWIGCSVIVFSVVVGCHKPDPDCQDAMRSLVRHVPLGSSAQRSATEFCAKGASAQLRGCLADVESEQALQACLAQEPSAADSIKRLDVATRDAAAWTTTKQAELDKLQSDQEALMKQMESAYDAIVDAKTGAEQAARRAALDDLRVKHNAMDAPIAAAKAAQAAAQAANDARKTVCGENPLLAGCH